MQQTWGIEAEKHGAQFVVAIFDDWEALHAVLVDLEARATLRSGAVLHARTDIPPHVSTLGLLKEMAQLHFVRSRQHIACTVGRLSQELSDRLAKGARSLAEALHCCLSSEQAGQLESHIERGHLVLCVQLHTPEDFSVICGRLVRASPHMVELCNIRFESRHQGKKRSGTPWQRERAPLLPSGLRAVLA
jgi:hypothetical protein